MAWENQNGKTDIKSLALTELERELAALGEKPFRANQLYQWLHQKLARSYEDMTNLPKGLRERLGGTICLYHSAPGAGAGVPDRRYQKIPFCPGGRPCGGKCVDAL